MKAVSYNDYGDYYEYDWSWHLCNPPQEKRLARMIDGTLWTERKVIAVRYDNGQTCVFRAKDAL